MRRHCLDNTAFYGHLLQSEDVTASATASPVDLKSVAKRQPKAVSKVKLKKDPKTGDTQTQDDALADNPNEDTEEDTAHGEVEEDPEGHLMHQGKDNDPPLGNSMPPQKTVKKAPYLLLSLSRAA